MYSKDIPERFQEPKEPSVIETILLVLCDLLERLAEERPLEESYSEYHGENRLGCDQGAMEYNENREKLEEILQSMNDLDDYKLRKYREEHGVYNPY